MTDEGPTSDAATRAKRIAIALIVIVALTLVGAIAAALLAHPSSSASAIAPGGLGSPGTVATA